MPAVMAVGGTVVLAAVAGALTGLRDRHVWALLALVVLMAAAVEAGNGAWPRAAADAAIFILFARGWWRDTRRSRVRCAVRARWRATGHRRTQKTTSTQGAQP